MMNVIMLAMVIVGCEAVNFNGVLNTVMSYQTITYVVTTNQNYLTLTLTTTPIGSAVLALIKNAPFSPSANTLHWLHVNPKASTEFDYQGMVTARQQNAWISNPGLNQTIYIYLINFQRKLTPSYTVILTETNTIATKCSNPHYYQQTFYCLSCPSGQTGVYCSIQNNKLSQYEVKQIIVAPYGYGLFTLVAGNDLTVKIYSNKGGVSIYFQYNAYFQEASGLVNYVHNGDVLGHYHFASKGQREVFLYNGENSVSVGVINMNSSQAAVWLEFQEKVESNIIMIIIISVLGTIVLVGIITFIIVIVRRKREQRQVRQQVRIRSSSSPVMVNLSAFQLQELYPAVVRAKVLPEMGSKSSLSEMEDEKNDYDCSICLCSISSEQTIRVAFCRHIFHAKCLLTWFNKQQNCPYCRQSCNRKVSLKNYIQLSKQMGYKPKGLQLVRGILRPRVNMTQQNLQFEDIEDKL